MDFMNKDTMCYKCGNNVKFMGIDGTESVYPTNGMRSFAAHSVNKIFAVADNGLPPVINIVKYPDLQTVSQLTGKPTHTQVAFLKCNSIATCHFFRIHPGKEADQGKRVQVKISYRVVRKQRRTAISPATQVTCAIYFFVKSKKYLSIQSKHAKLMNIDNCMAK